MQKLNVIFQIVRKTISLQTIREMTMISPNSILNSAWRPSSTVLTLVCISCLWLCSPAKPDVYTVTNTNDAGPGSLKQAIFDANAHPNIDVNTPDAIVFDVCGGGPQTIFVTTFIPTISDSVIVDATTQPGYNGSPIIVVNGGAIAGNVAFDIRSGNTTVRGLVIEDFSYGFQIKTAGGNLIESNYLGTDITGTFDQNAGIIGIGIFDGADGNTVRGNLISGFTDHVNAQGISIGSDENLIEYNMIGTDVTGTLPIPNRNGIGIVSSSSNIVTNNLVSGSLARNIWMQNDGNGNTISNNLVGTDVTGTNVLGSTTLAGISLMLADDNVFEGNVVGGVTSDPLRSAGFTIQESQGNVVKGNFVGTDVSGQIDLGNLVGIKVVFASDNEIVENVVANNAEQGVALFTNGQGPTARNRIQQNSIFGNGGLGIDLVKSFVVVNPNDSLDLTGVFNSSNRFQNYPILSLVEGGASTHVVGTFNSEPLETFELEFFANSAADPSGHGEGERFLDRINLTTDANGDALFDSFLLAASTGGEWITATATDSVGNTSEFSFALLITNTDPNADAGPNQELDCTNSDGALVSLDGTGSSDPDDDELTYQWSVPTGIALDDSTSPTPMGFFPIGITVATLTVTDGNGGVACDDVQITVIDNLPPEVSCTTDVMALWPPNHQMENVEVFVDATDNCTNPENLILLSLTVSSDEPDDATGTGDGETTGDVNGADGFTYSVDLTNQFAYNAMTESFEGTISLRAEREGTGVGRTYTITAQVLDNANNLAETSCVVVVPHDRRGGPNN